MITVTVFSLTMPPCPMFARTFTRRLEADDYMAFWRRLGHCHLKRQVRS